MTAADATLELPGIQPLAPPGYPRPFGQYLLLTPLAAGGMGEVFLASSRGSAGAVRLVVIKTLRPDLAREPGYVNRFLDEARIVVQLQHANICQVFDVGKQDGAHFFAMEHIAGINLRRLLDALTQAGKSLPPSIAIFLVAEILEGLDAAHRHRHPLTGQALNVVHRDVSPHNAMVSFEGDVKLIDFGLAASEMKMEHTESQVVMGKIAYMSPEQARGEPVDASSDQFSAAIVLYELLANERYYGDMNQREIWSTAGARDFVPRRWRDLDGDVATVLQRALAHERKERWPTCGEFAAALRVILQNRYPFAGKAMLRSFVRDSVAQDRENSEMTLRNLGSLAMSAMPAVEQSATNATSNPGLRTGITKSGAQQVLSETGTGSTRTYMVFGKERGRGWPMALIAAFGGLALGALGMIAVLPRLLAQQPAPPVAAVVVEPVAPTAAVVPAVVEPVAPVEPTAPVAVEPVAPVVEPPVAPVVESEPVKKRPRREKPPEPPKVKKPSWATWTEAKKLEALAPCDDRCARTLRSIKQRGEQLTPAALDTCLERCSAKK